MEPKKKKIIIVSVSLVIIGGIVWYVYNEHKKEKAKAAAITVTSNNPVITSPAVSSSTIPAPVSNSSSAPKPKGPSSTPIKSPVDAPVSPKPVSADSLIGTKGEMAIVGKTLIAKSNGAGIYSTTNQKVSVTNAGEKLGKAFLATRMKAGNYLIKYQDNSGNYRVIASSSVNAI